MKKLMIIGGLCLLFGTTSMAQNAPTLCESFNVPETVHTDVSNDPTIAFAQLGPFGQLQDGETFELQIFNRWGASIWQSNDPSQAWDLKREDELIPEGTYFYVVNIACASGSLQNKGNITVIE